MNSLQKYYLYDDPYQMSKRQAIGMFRPGLTEAHLATIDATYRENDYPRKPSPENLLKAFYKQHIFSSPLRPDFIFETQNNLSCWSDLHIGEQDSNSYFVSPFPACSFRLEEYYLVPLNMASMVQESLWIVNKEIAQLSIERDAIESPVTSESKRPWELAKWKLEIVKHYDAKIVGENSNTYNIEFYDEDDSLVEASLSRDKFRELPYPVTVDSEFWIFIYRIKGSSETRISVWPIGKYWHKSWSD